MRRTICAASLVGLVLAIDLTHTPMGSTSVSSAKAKGNWPHPVPLRVSDGNNRGLFVMTFGDVQTSLADGIFDPQTDQVTLKDGKVIKDYYAGTLGVRYFKPIDKSKFALPPSGWCTWYYYYQQINENEVKQNTRWI